VRNLAAAWQRLHEILGEGRQLNASQQNALRTAEAALWAAGMLRQYPQQVSRDGAVPGAKPDAVATNQQATQSEASTLPQKTRLPATAMFHSSINLPDYARL
jgi:hypothetical protein